LIVIMTLGVIGLAWSTRTWKHTPPVVAAALPVATQTTTNPSPVKVISITVNPDGFSPSDVDVPEGLYLLDINDRTGLPEINVQLGNLNSKKLKEAKPAKDKQGRILKMQDYRGLFSLENGQYTITEANHPKWSLKIKVTAKPK
jgi:hypothetical protein